MTADPKLDPTERARNDRYRTERLEPGEPKADGQTARRISRRKVLAAAGGTGALASLSYLLLRRRRGPTLGSGRRDDFAADIVRSRRPADALDKLAAHIQNGGPGKDGIPAIDEPNFVSPAEATFLTDDDVVFGIVRGDEVRAYPQLVLVWHEIVNDRFNDGPLSITYCPLTGSVIAFRGTVPQGRPHEGEPFTFGTTGDLVNSNLLMYDRQTDSRWPQILGQAILGLKGQVLEEVPLDWTTWGRWRATHPETVVLSTKTGFLRPYGTDPYGSYNYNGQGELAGYYKPGQGRNLYFPLMRESSRFDEKEVMLGVKLGSDHLAIRKALLRQRSAIMTTMDGSPVAVLYDPALDAGRAYLARGSGQVLNLTPAAQPGLYVDRSSGSTWDALGRGASGRLANSDLQRIVSFDVMWLGWFAFFP